jgi:hypothetical protein
MNKLFEPLINYLKGLIDSKHSADAKTFVGLVSFFYIMIVGFVDLFTDLSPSDTVFFGILGLVIGVFGISAYQFQKEMTIKGDIASDIVNKEPQPSKQTTDSAKQVLKEDIKDSKPTLPID